MSDFDLDKTKKFLKDPMRYSEKNVEWVDFYLNGAIAEVERLRSELKICDEVDDETQVVLNHYEKLVDENSALKTKTEFDWAHRQKVEAENVELKDSWGLRQEFDERGHKIAELEKNLAASEKALKELKTKEIAWLKQDELRSRTEAQILINRTKE